MSITLPVSIVSQPGAVPSLAFSKPRRTVLALAAFMFLAASAFANTYIVTNTLDDNNAGSLRYAVNQANANAGPDVIVFDISGTGPFSIAINSTLTLTGPTVIDGTTQPGFTSGTQSTYVKVGTAFTGTIFSASGVTGITIKGLDLSYSNPRQGAGIGFGTCNQTFILDNFIRNRRTGISINGGQDHTVQNNDLLASGENTNEPCVYLANITPGSIPSGVAMSNNKFGGNANMGFRFDNMNNLVIRDALVSGANIVIEDNSGFTAMGTAGQFMMWFNNCNNITVDNVDLSWLGGGISSSHGIIISNAVTNSTFTVKNCSIKNRYSGIQMVNGKDVIIQNNDLRGSGHEDSYAVNLNNITEANVNGGILMSGNTWGRNGAIESNGGLRLSNTNNLIIGDENTGVNIKIEDNSGFNTIQGINANRNPMYLENVSNLTVDNVDASWSLGGIVASMGIRIQNTGSNGNITIKNCKVQNRHYGIYCNDGKDYTITGNDFRGSGHENLYALYLLNIAEGMIPGGVSVSGNTWGRNGAIESNGGLYIADMSNLIIGDATTGVHIKIEDNSGFNTIMGNEGSYRGALWLERVSNITVDNVDASWSLGGIISNSFGIFVQNETGAYFGQTTSHRNVTIKDCDFRNRGQGIRIRGGKDYTVTGNDLRGCGEHGHHALQLINIQAGTLTGGILAHTNKFGTGALAINGGIYIQQMNDLTIGDATTGGNIQIEDNSGLNQIVGNDVNSRGALYLNTVNNVTVNSVDCSYSPVGQAGSSFGIRVANTASNSNISILNCNAGNRGRGIWVDNGRDYTITGNNMVGSGNGSPAFELSNIIPGSLTGGILASGNTFGTPNFHRGVAISNMRDLLIGDASVLNANFVLEDNSGLNQCVGGDYNSHGALYLTNVNNVTVDNVDCSKSTTGASNSYGIVVANGANNQGITIKNCKADNRYRGIYCSGGKDYTVQNNTITNSGIDGTACALDFRDITAGTLPGGVLVSGNTFGNVPITANTSRAGVRFDNMRDLYIGDATTGGNVKIEDGSGLTEVGFDLNSAYVVLNLNNISNSTIDNLNLSYSGTNQNGNAIRLSNGASQGTVTIKNCTINNRRLGIYVGGGRDYTITGNNLTGTGLNSSADINNGGPAVWLNGLVKGTLDGGIAMSGNTFGGANAHCALRVDDMRGFTIGDAVSDDIVFEDGTSGLTNVGSNGTSNEYVLYLRQIADVTVNSVDLTRSGGTQFGGGIRVDNNNGQKNVTLSNNGVGNRRTGIYISGGSDYTVTGNTLTGSGLNETEPALYLNGITAGTLPGGLSVSANTFGGTNANTAVRFENLKDIVIGDASVSGRNVTLEDGTSGLSTVGNNANSLESVLYFSNLTNSSINNVDLTRTGGTQLGRGIYVANGLTSYPFSITNCAVGNRRTGIHINGGRNYTVQNNTLTGSGNNFNEPALYLNSLTVNSNLVINGNTFGGANFNTGIRVENISDLLISDGMVSGTHIGVTTANGLGNATGYALYLANLTRTKVQNMDLSFTTNTRTGTGIQVTTNSGTTAQVEMKSLTVKNRVDGINITSGANHSVKCSDLSDNSDGLEIASSVTSFVCEQNSFVGNVGFAINSAATITAENNYFGGGAPGGGANGVTGSVDATPFLTSAPANCPTTMAAYLELKGNQNLILNGSTTPTTINYTDFGSVKTSTPITRTFTINNPGGVALNITSISFTGGNAGDFSASALTPASPVPPGGSATFTITFTPGAASLRSTTLSIVNDDPNNNPYTAALQGTGKNVLVVNSTDDVNDGVCDGAHCSLREAITVANSNADADVIEFNIGGGGAQTITHTTAFPNITQPLTIDGSSQPGFAGTPLITVNSNNSFTTFTASNVTGLTIKYMDLSRPIANYDGNGIIMSSCNEVFILNNIIKNRFIGIQSNGGRDHTIQNNNLQQTGADINNPAIYLNGLTARDVPGGIKMSGNLFGDAASGNRSRFGIRINTMSNLLIGDASVSGANITIETNSGMASTGTGDNYCLLLNNVSNTTVDNLDLTATTYGYQGWGIVVSNTADYGNVTIKRCKINNRYAGVYCAGGRDYTVQNNDLQKTGNDLTRPSLWFQNITPGTLPTGILASGNLFGDAGGLTRTALRVDGATGLLIGNQMVVGAHITIEDISGIKAAASGDNYAVYLANVSNTTVDKLDLSSTIGYQGWGLVVQNSASNSNVTIQNCKINGRYAGIYCIGGKDYTILKNDLKNTSNDNTRPALYLSGIRPGTLAAGVAASGNSFGFLTQTAKTALRIDNMDGLVIGDAVGGGVHIAIEDASGANTMNNDADAAVIYLSAVSNLTVNDVDVSRSASLRSGVGIWVENGGSTVYRNLSILNCKMQQRDMGLYINGGKDVTVTNNDMRYCGSYQDRPALWLGNIQSISLPGGVSLSGNKFGGSSNGATSNSGIQFVNMRDLVMADAAAPGVNIVLEDNSGLNDVYGDEVSTRGAMYLNNVRNVQMTSIDLSKTTAGQGASYALKVNAGVNVNVLNGKGSNRFHGYYFEGGRDITVTGNDLTGSGNQRDYPALRFSNVQPGSINTANGITASGNLFGGANVRTGLRIDNAKNLLIGNASVSGAHIVIADNSGLNNITQGDGNSSEHPAIYLSTVSDITVDKVDASRPSGRDMAGIWVSNSVTNSNVTIKNCNFNGHNRAIYCTGGRDYTIQNNSLLNSGLTNDQPAIYLQNIQQGSLTGGILMSGNTFGGTLSFGGIRFENMRDLTIGDLNTGGNVTIEDNSGLNNMGGNSGGNSLYYVLHFNNVNNATVDNVDLARAVGATPAQDFTGIRIDNGAAYGPITIKDCDISRHRVGISAQGGKDYTVTGNDLRGCGGSSDDPALWFNGITQQNSTVPMGIIANTNTFGTVNSVVSNCALRLDNLCGIRISDGTVANSHIKIAAASGIKEVTGTGGNNPTVILMANTSGMAVEKLDLEFTGTQTGTGIRFQNANASQYGFSIKDNILKNRRMGVFIINGADYTITGNNFSMTGAADDEPAIRMEHVAEGTLYGGVSMSGNTFGGTGAAFGLKFLNMSNLKISDGSLSGTNVNLGSPSANGLYNVTTGNVLHLSGICNATVDMLDLSRVGLTRQGVGLRMNAGMGNTIQKVLVGNRDKGIEIAGGSNSQSFTCNTLFDNNLGIDVVLGTLLSTTLANNIMDCNGTGLRSTSTSTVAASNNYWGTANGSTTSGGSGDSYSGTVTATPFLATAPACAQTPPDLETKGNSVEIVDGDITPSFDDYTQYCAVTGQVQSRTYTLKNTGNGIMNLVGASPVTLSPASGTPFTITSQPADVELLPGETTTFSIQFAPVALGTSNVTLNIASKDCRENPYNFALKGQGCVDIQGTISGTQAICAGLSANLTVNISAGLAPFVVTLSDGSTFTVNNIGDNTVTVSPTATTTYTIAMITDANGCCSTNTGSAIVTVNPLPTPTITVSETSGTMNHDGILCAGASATLDAGVYAAWEWTGGTTAQTFSVTAAGTYTVTVTDGNGCKGTDTQAIVVNSNPTPTITETDNSGTANDNILCAGGSATLDAGAYSTYTWSPTGNTQTLSVSMAGTYTVVVTDANGCTGTDDQAIAVNALPDATLSGAVLVCPGTTSAILDLNITAGVAPFTVVLSDNSSHNVAALGMSQLTVAVAEPGPLSFSITSITGGGGCVGSASGTATVDFGSTGEIEISGNGTPITDGDNMPDPVDHTDFGLVAVGGNFTRTFTITNSHLTLPLNISGVTITGSTDFTLITAPASSVAANGGTTTFVVKFAPTALGLASATVVVNSSDCDEQPYNFAIQGIVPSSYHALDFDGVNDYVDVPAGLPTFDEFTIEAWVRPESFGGLRCILMYNSFNTGYLHYQFNENQMEFSIAGNAPTDQYLNATTFTANTWYHIAAVYSKSAKTLKWYVNGILQETDTYTTAIGLAPNVGFKVGSWDGTSRFFDGQIDEVRMWNTTLSDSELAVRYNKTTADCDPLWSNLTTYWNFEENSGNMTADKSNSCRNGFITNGGTWTTTVPTLTPYCNGNLSLKPEINVKGNGTDIADGDITPSTTDHTKFGNLLVNGSLARTFTIFNTGSTDLTISSITSSNSNFTIGTLTPASPIAGPSGSAMFTVTFNPTTLGVQNATITINNNDCDETVYDFVVTGTGATPASALNFDGIDDYISTANNTTLDLSTQTVELWAKPSGSGGDNDLLVGKRNYNAAGNNGIRWSIHFQNGNQGLYFYSPAGQAVWTYTFTPNQWYHIAMVTDATSTKLYIDGTFISSKATTINSPTNLPVIFGASGPNFEVFPGSLDEVRIWNTARTCDQINQLRNCELTGSESGLMAYYKFNQGFAGEDNTTPPVNTLTDATANANNGTLTGFTLTGAISNWVTPGGVVTGTSCPAVVVPEIDVRGGSPLVSILDGDATPSTTDGTDFGNVAVNGNLTRMFTIFNTGNDALSITSITSSNPKFTIGTLTPASPIAGPSGSATFTVTFNPTALGVQNATITINNSDCDEAAYDFAVTGKGVEPGAALHFDGATDGTGDFVSLGNSSFNNIGAITISAWIKPEPRGTVGFQEIWSKELVNTFAINNATGKLHVNFGNGSSFGTARESTSSIPTDGTWTHVAATRSAAGVVKVYVNGVLESTGNNALTGFNLFVRSIGSKPSSAPLSSQMYKGVIDELSIWTRDLCQEEIQHFMTCELDPAGQVGLSALYRFNQGFAGENNSGVTTLLDVTGSGKNGTLNNFTLNGPTSNWVTPGGVSNGNSCPVLIAPEINVQGGSPLVTITDGDITPSTADNTDFGLAFVNGSVARMFTIFNTGNTPLTITNIQSDNTQFVASSVPASVDGGNSATFMVTFTPTATGTQTATITINNSDCNESAYDFAVTGKGAVPGQALSFDGNNDFVNCGNATAFNPNNIKTMETWVKFNNLTNDQDIMAKATTCSGIEMLLFGSNLSVYFMKDCSKFSHIDYPKSNLTTGQWYHIAVTWDGTKESIRMYLDGVSVGTLTHSGDINPTGIANPANGFYLGQWGPSSRPLNGVLDEARVWSTTRTCEQINQLRNCELTTGSESGLVAYYKFNQGYAGENNSGLTTLIDATGNNNGTLNTFALNGATSNWVTPGGVTTGTSCPAVTAPEANVQGNGVDIADGDATPSTADHTDFGLVAVNGNLVRMFTLFNTGDAALTINSIMSNNGLFVVSDAPTSVSANSSATFKVTFNPTATGEQNATITINNGDCDEAVYDFVVKGKGATPASALHFDGVNDFVNLGTSLGNFGTGDFSVETWFKTPSTGFGPLVCKRSVCSGENFWSIYMDNTGKISFQLSQNTFLLNSVFLNTSLSYNDNIWHHLAFTRSGTEVKGYIDGALVVSGNSAAPTNLNNATALTLGSLPCGLFNGSMDEVRIWTVARTCEEINQLRNCELTGLESGLVAYYKFNQGFADEDNSTPPVNTLTDATANGNNGTLNGFALNGAMSNWITPGSVVTGTSCPASITYPEANLLGHDNTPLADGTTSTSVAQGTNFGSVNFGSSSAAKTFTIQNNGTTAMNVTSIVSSNPQFEITALTLPGPIAVGMSAEFTITFTPTANGVQNATITIHNNDCDEAMYDFAVTGTGACIPPSFTVCPTGPLTANTVTGTCAAPVNYTVTEAGNPAPTVTYAFTGATTGGSTGTGSGSSFNKGSTIVTVTATSTCNPAATCSFTVTVTDNEKPQITCAAPVNINTTAGQCTGTTTLTDPTVTDNCPLGNGLDFGGDNDYVSFPSNVLSTATAFTFETWINPRSHAGWARIFDFGNGLQNLVMLSSSVGGSGVPAFYIFSGGVAQQVTAPSAIPLNTWTHIAVTLSGTTATMYINGVQVAQNTSFTWNPAVVGATSNNWLGRSQQSQDAYLDGKLDEVRFWNVARSQAQIQASMSKELAGNESGLVAYYRLNQGTAGNDNTGINTAIAATGPTGTLNNFALNGPSSNWVKGVFGALTNDAPPTYPKGATTVTWTTTDASGNTQTCQQTVTVTDNEAPVLTVPAANIPLNVIATTCAADYTIASPISDNCTGSTWTYSLSGATTAATSSAIASGMGSGVLSFNKGVTTVTLNGVDAATNAAVQKTFTVTVADDEKPQITCAGPVNINTTAGQCTGTTTLTAPNVTDNCPFGGNGLNFDGSNDQLATAAYSGTALTGDLTMECWFKGTSMNGRALMGRGYQQEFDLTLWSNQLSYYHGNGSATYAEVNFSYVFTDNTWYHVAVVRNASAQTVSLYVNGVFQQTLVYGTPLPVAQTAAFRIGHRAAGQSFLGSIDEVRIWTVARTPAQIAGNWNKELAAQPDLFALYHLNEGVANADNTGATTAADASGNAKDGTLTNFALSGTSSNWGIGAFGGVTNNAPATYPKGNTTVTWTATDASGNTKTCQQTVTVTDNEKPTISGCATDQSINVIATTCAANYAIPAPTLMDNCAGPLTWNAAFSGNAMNPTNLSGLTNGVPSSNVSFNKGTTTVTLTATDAANNTSTVTCSFVVTVVDNVKPQITCTGNITQNTNAGTCVATVTVPSPTATDNCSLTNTTNSFNGTSDASGNYPKGTTTVTWTATDASGNTETCQQTVTVTDNQAPAIICPTAAIVCSNPYSNTYVGTSALHPTVTDNCSSLANVSYVLTGATTGTGNGLLTGKTFNLNNTTIRYTVTDGNGPGTASCTFVLTVRKSPWPYWQPGSLSTPTGNYNLAPLVKDYRAASKQYKIYLGTPSGSPVCVLNATNGVVTAGQTCTVTHAAPGLYQYYAVAVNDYATGLDCEFTSVALPITVTGPGQPNEGDQTLANQEASQFAPVLYPNPTDGLLYVRFESGEPDGLRMMLYDTDGRLVLESSGARQPQLPSAAGATQQFDLSQLPSGVYLFRLVAGEQQYTGRVVKVE